MSLVHSVYLCFCSFLPVSGHKKGRGVTSAFGFVYGIAYNINVPQIVPLRNFDDTIFSNSEIFLRTNFRAQHNDTGV
jgi:hypothetical protein